MAFDVTVELVDPFVKVILTELNEQDNPKDGRQWYVNMPCSEIEDGEDIELDDDEMEKVLADLLAQRDATIAQENVNDNLAGAVEGWLREKLPE